LLLPAGALPQGQEHDELIYCEGNLALADRSAFHREICCRGTFASGFGALLQAVAADGEAVLGEETEVSRWVDARGRVLLKRGSTVRSRVSSLESIELEPQASAQSLYAPLVFTSGYQPFPDGVAGEAVASPIPASVSAPMWEPARVPGAVFTRMTPDTWLVRGDLNLPAGTRLAEKLVVQGELRSGADCYFASDIKAADVIAGPRNHFLGNVVSEDGVELGEGGVVTGNVVAETAILLCAGVRVGREGRPVVVNAGGEVRMKPNVAVHGKIAAVRAVSAL